MEYQGYDISAAQALIPKLQRLLLTFRNGGFPIYHTREGKFHHIYNWPSLHSWAIADLSPLGHRPDMSTVSVREHFRSRNNLSRIGIGDTGPMGRLLIRGEPGHDLVPELYPDFSEPVIDKPGRGAFLYTDFDLLLRNKGIKNLILAGVGTDVGVSTTMREANDRGFDCVLLEDACVAADPAFHASTVETVKMEGGAFGAVTAVDDMIHAVDNFRSTVAKKLAPQMPEAAGVPG